MFRGVGSTEQKILVYLALEPRAKASDITKVFPNLPPYTVRRAMRSLAKKEAVLLDDRAPMTVSRLDVEIRAERAGLSGGSKDISRERTFAPVSMVIQTPRQIGSQSPELWSKGGPRPEARGPASASATRPEWVESIRPGSRADFLAGLSSPAHRASPLVVPRPLPIARIPTGSGGPPNPSPSGAIGLGQALATKQAAQVRRKQAVSPVVMPGSGIEVIPASASGGFDRPPSPRPVITSHQNEISFDS